MSSFRMKLALLLTGLAVLGVYVVAFLLSTTDDRVDQLDSSALEDAAKPACLALRVDLDALPPLEPGAGPLPRIYRVSEQAAAVRRFVAQVSQVGPEALDADQPARTWLADWETLVRIREDYVTQGLTGDFTIPLDQDAVITRRMNDIGVDECAVPQSLVAVP